MNWPLLLAMASILIPATVLAVCLSWEYRDVDCDMKIKKKTRKAKQH